MAKDVHPESSDEETNCKQTEPSNSKIRKAFIVCKTFTMIICEML